MGAYEKLVLKLSKYYKRDLSRKIMVAQSQKEYHLSLAELSYKREEIWVVRERGLCYPLEHRHNTGSC